MAGPSRKDHQAIGFRVELDGIDSGCVPQVRRPEVRDGSVRVPGGRRQRGHPQAIGPTKASNIVLTKGFISDPALFKWRDEIQASGTKKIARRNGSIVALAADGKTEVGRWNFQKAWPVRWEMTEFDAASGEAACEILELAVHAVTKG